MKLKSISITVLLIVSGCLSGQNVSYESTQGIQANFSQKSIKAHQFNSQNKLKAFYEYLTLYSNEKDEKLKKQIQSNILSLVSSENIEVVDFTNSNQSLIQLSELLSKIENEHYAFTIAQIESSENISSYEWENDYQLKIAKGNHSEIRKLSQTIIFEPLEKKFGTKSKWVWEMKLNEMFED